MYRPGRPVRGHSLGFEDEDLGSCVFVFPAIMASDVF